MSNIKYELLGLHVFVTKLAGFEHSEYIQHNQTVNKRNDSDIPLVQGKNIRDGNFVEQYDWYIKKEISDHLIRSKLTKRCILVPYVGSNLGEVGIFYHPYDCHLASNIAKIELIDDYFDLEYLKYYLQSPIGQSYLFQSKQGSAQPNITMEAIRNTLVIDYPKDIQEKIVSILKPIDKKIEINKKNNEKLEALAKIIYDYWFLQFEFPNEEGRPYKSSGGKMVYNEQLKREIPEGWEVKTLKNSRLFSIIKQGVEYFSKKIYLATANVIGNDIIDGNVVDYENREGRANMQSTLNSVWFAKMKNSIKHIFISKSDNWMIDKYVISTGFMGLQCGENSFPYIVGFISSKYFEKLKDYRSGGSTQEGINEEDLNLFPIIEPSDDILIKYANLVTGLIEKLNKNRKENQELSSLRDFLLPLLMNGQVTFKEENEKLDSESKQVITIPYLDGFNQWKQMQGYALRGNADEEILKQIYDAMDEDDKK